MPTPGVASKVNDEVRRSAPTCTACNVIMHRGPQGTRCLNCGATAECVLVQDKAVWAVRVPDHVLDGELAEQIQASMDEQHHALARALNMPGEPFPVLLARAKENAKAAKAYHELQAILGHHLAATDHGGKGGR